MKIITDVKNFQTMAHKERAKGKKTALVPTMGFFHEGHLSLIRYAKKQADTVYVSLFVNPTQFGPNEDLDTYPRDEARDKTLAKEAGADVLFCPDKSSIYAPDHGTWVEVPTLARHLCGKSRPAFFRGVATVCSILFNLALPQIAVFGEKDWQQLTLIRKLIRDMHLPVEIKSCPIVREADGLAMSSRNACLTQKERTIAPFLYKGLLYAEELAKTGMQETSALQDALTAFYSQYMPHGELDYADFMNPQTISPVKKVSGPVLVAVAMKLGKTRLIDNIII